MATLQELEAKLVELQETVDSEQADVQALLASNQETVAALEAQIVSLQEQLAASANPEQIQAVIDSLEAIKSDVQTTV